MAGHGRAAQESAESLTALLIDSVVDYAIFVLDTRGEVRSWNPGAERLKGYPADEIIGRNFSTFYTPEDREAGLPDALLARAADEGRVTHSGWRVRRDGTRFYGDVTITALRDGDGVLRGFAKVTRDRTEHHRTQEAMARALEQERRAAQELVDLQEERSQFMAAVSHDLQTPLSAIHGGLQLLRDDATDLDVIGLVERNVDRLVQMTRQLSEASRLERGRVDVAPQPTPLPEAVDEAVLALRPVLGDREVQVDVGGTVHVDALAFQRILANLLTNAHRHGPVGTPLHVVTDAQDAWVVLAVEDHGPGVPVAERDRVFDEFRQGDDQPQGRGLGLGLSIVRSYVAAHGGDTWMEDRDGGGARVCLTLPAAAATGAA